MNGRRGPLAGAAGLFLLLLAPSGPAQAQAPVPAPAAKAVPLPPNVPAPTREPAPAASPAPAPYEAQLDRLSELMGTLAFMRQLCGNGDAATWHDKMAALLDAEARSGTRKDRLAGSYNRGFDGYRLTYRTCTPAAHEVIARSLAEGASLANDLSIRFGSD